MKRGYKWVKTIAYCHWLNTEYPHSVRKHDCDIDQMMMAYIAGWEEAVKRRRKQRRKKIAL